MAKRVVKLRKDGAINVPSGIRNMYGLKPGMTFELDVSKTGLTYKRTYLNCPVCGLPQADQHQVRVLDSQVCSACDRKIGAILAAGEATSISGAIRLLASRSKKTVARMK